MPFIIQCSLVILQTCNSLLGHVSKSNGYVPLVFCLSSILGEANGSMDRWIQSGDVSGSTIAVDCIFWRRNFEVKGNLLEYLF